jgi:hypothetical protein
MVLPCRKRKNPSTRVQYPFHSSRIGRSQGRRRGAACDCGTSSRTQSGQKLDASVRLTALQTDQPNELQSNRIPATKENVAACKLFRRFQRSELLTVSLPGAHWSFRKYSGFSVQVGTSSPNGLHRYSVAPARNARRGAEAQTPSRQRYSWRDGRSC